jgi:hypothetical protein
MNRKWILICMTLALCIAQAGMGKGKDPSAPDNGKANDPTLVAWWTLDETSGDTANDTSVGAQHGKLKGGPVWTNGRKAGALEFDGKDDYVAITKAFFNKKNIEAMTVAAWIRTSSPNNQVIVSFDHDEYWGLEVNGPSGKNGQACWIVMTDAGQLNLASRARVNDGQWHHVAGVFDNGIATLYVDGAADAVKTTGRSCGNGNKRYGFLGVGSRADQYDGTKVPGTYYAGDMDDVRIYSRALTKSEIVELSFFGPANDDCQYAEPVGEVANLAFDTTEASADGQGLCMVSPNLWYVYAPSGTGVATVSLLGSRYDTMLSIYRGAECNPGPDRLIGCNDDFSGLQSQLTFDAVGGQQYLVEVGGWSRCTGQGVLTISLQVTVRPECDLGDAPDSSTDWTKRMTAYPDGVAGAVLGHFPTVYEDTVGQPRGPVHLAPRSKAYLGAAVSLENEANKGIDEDVVNNINQSQDKANQDGADDGVVLPLPLPHGQFANFEYVVKVIQPVQSAWVNVWFDWNRDGDWDDDSTSNPEMTTDDNGRVSEWAVQNQFLYDLPVGTHHIITPAFRAWHPAIGPAKIWMRITLSEKPWKGGEHPGLLGNGGSGPAEGYEIGETEDYLITPQTGSACSICQDLNKDGKLDFDDLIALLYKWLGECMN